MRRFSEKLLSVRNFSTLFWIQIVYNLYHCLLWNLLWTLRITWTCTRLLNIHLAWTVFELHWIIWAYLGSLNSQTFSFTLGNRPVFCVSALTAVSRHWKQSLSKQFMEQLVQCFKTAELCPIIRWWTLLAPIETRIFGGTDQLKSLYW
jgi:hypothetical protein